MSRTQNMDSGNKERSLNQMQNTYSSHPKLRESQSIKSNVHKSVCPQLNRSLKKSVV